MANLENRSLCYGYFYHLASVFFLSCHNQLKSSKSYNNVAIWPHILLLVSLHYEYFNFFSQSVQGHFNLYMIRVSFGIN